MYENDTDYVSAARAIDLYKADKGLNKRKTRSDKDAATSVGVRNSSSAPSNDDSDGSFYESQVNKMSIQQYEANQEAIEKAIRSGKFVYDVSGSAR